MDTHAIKIRLKNLAEKIDALGVRERGLIFISVLAMLYLIAFNVVFAPLRAEQSRLDHELKAKYEQIKLANAQLNILSSGATGNEQYTKITSLRQQVAQLDAGMDRMTAGVVTPKEMAKLVEQMLTRNKNLQLVKLEALPPKSIDEQAPVAEPAQAAATATSPIPSATVYRHGMRIEFKGRYFDIVDYLQSLEKLPWKVFWGEVSLETDEYPISKVTLVIYTLSRYPGWIGV